MRDLLKSVPANLIALATSEFSKRDFIDEYVSIFDKDREKKANYFGMIWDECHKGEVREEVNHL